MTHSDPGAPSHQGSMYSGARSHTGSMPVPPTPVTNLYGPVYGQVTPSPTVQPSSQPPVDSFTQSQQWNQDDLSHQVHVQDEITLPPPGFSPPPSSLPHTRVAPMEVQVPSAAQDDFDQYSQVSQQTSPFDMIIPPVPVGNYVEFLHWISTNFATYFPITSNSKLILVPILKFLKVVLL